MSLQVAIGLMLPILLLLPWSWRQQSAEETARSEIAQTKEALGAALAASASDLRHKVDALAADPLVSRAQSDTAEKVLASSLIPGTIDGVAILASGNCTASGIKTECPGQSPSGLRIVGGDESNVAQLVYSRATPAITGVTQLGQHWRAKHKLFSDFELSTIKNEKIFGEWNLGTETPLYLTQVKGAEQLWFPFSIGLERLCYVALLLIGAAYGGSRLRATTRLLSDFQRVAQGIGAAESVDLAKKIKERERALEIESQSLAEELRHAEREQKRLSEALLSERKARVPATVALCLQHQVNQFRDLLSAHVGTVHERILDLDSILRDAQQPAAQRALSLVQTWLKGIQDRGARKFFRAMVETKTETGVSTFEANLKDLADATLALQSTGIALRRVADELKTKQENAASMTMHLLGMTEQTDQAPNLLKSISAAQSLLNLTHPQIFELKIHAESAASTLPQAPADIWIAAFYHLMAALYELEPVERKLPLVVQNRSKKHRSLVFMRPFTGPTSSAFPDRFRKHMQLVQTLTNSLGVELTYLPATGQFFPVTMSWHPHAENEGGYGKAEQPLA